MTHLSNGTVATDLDAHDDNAALAAQGYTIRHIETWHDLDHTCIVWDAPGDHRMPTCPTEPRSKRGRPTRVGPFRMILAGQRLTP